MPKFILQRLASMLMTMLLVSVFVFLMNEVAPGDVALHILGIDAKPEQLELFRRQMGLEQPLATRYASWLFGSDWRAQRLIGMPLVRIREDRTGLWEWFAQTPDGTLRQWRMEDGELMAYVRQPDGSRLKQPAGDVWHTDTHEERSFWGVDIASRAVLWKSEELVEKVGPASSGRLASEQVGGVQYIPLERGLLRGDPGLSTRTNRPVRDILAQRLINSGILAFLAFVVVMPLAVLLGLIAGMNEGRALDRILSIGGLVTTASPNFATGIFLILIFASWLGVLPGATVFASEGAILKSPQMLILPVATLTLIELGYVLRITRASMIEVMGTAYMRTAILKGLPFRMIILKHAVRNALMAPITVIMLHVNWLMGGIVVVEALFGFPGLGTYLLESALYKDIYAIEAGAMVMVVLAVGTQLVADIIYTLLNPRIRYS